MYIKGMLIIALVMLLGSSVFMPTQAQLNDLIQRYAGVNADGFIEPLITGFGANLNSGLYRSAHVPKMGLHLNISLSAMMSVYSNDQRTFTATTTGYFYPPQQVETATVIGDTRGTIATSPSGAEYIFPGGYDMKSFMIGAPMVTVGSIFGTEASLRYFKAELNKDIGELSLFGIGARHSISQYIPLSPVDIAAGIFYHKFKISDIVDSKVYCLHAELGKSFAIIDLYGGLAYESTKAKVTYVFDSGIATEDVSIDVDGKNQFRFTVGTGFNFALLHINMDYSMGNQNVAHAGVSIGL